MSRVSKTTVVALASRLVPGRNRRSRPGQERESGGRHVVHAGETIGQLSMTINMA